MDIEDHRSLAKRLDLYHMEEEAPGMVFWHPQGYRIYRVLEDFIRIRMIRAGYQEVKTPQLLPRSLWEKSGHWEKFGANMFVVPRASDDEHGRDMALKPMSCPCHIQIFNDSLRSWRELPQRYAEFGQCHRNESSGSMHGLMRTRAFEQDDAHVLCEPAQIRSEVARFTEMLKEVYAALGFPEFDVALSLRPDVRAGSDMQWDWAEGELLAAAQACGLEPSLLPGEGAFYGPKLEFALRDRNGRSWQCGTIQLDTVLPGRLGAEYIDRDGKPATPMMIHHAVLGSMGRFIGILLEHHNGRLPLWLAPDQVAILPISEAQDDAARAAQDRLQAAGLRVRLMNQNETLSRRMVMAHEAFIPALVIIGKREAASGQVTLKRGEIQDVMPLEDAVLQMTDAAQRP